MRLLQRRIRVGNRGARFAQAEAELAEHPLALAHAQPNPVAPCEPDLQRLPVPEVPAQGRRGRRLPQYQLNLLQLRRAQSLGPAGSRPFHQPGKTALFEMPHPVFNRAGGIAQQSTNFRACHPLGDQQQPVETVIVSRFIRPANLILQSQNHGFGIGNAQWFNISMKPHFIMMRNYL